MTHHRKNEAGNVLWFIMIGLVLIGLLTAVLSRGGSSVDQGGDVEQLRVMAGQIMRTARAYESAVNQMKLRGISESDISFENTRTAIDYENTNCTRSDCLVFDAGGGGMTYTDPPPRSVMAAGTEWIFTGANNVGTTTYPVGTTAAGTGNDLLIMLPNITQALCTQINRILEVNEPDNTPPVDAGVSFTAFDGDYPSTTLVVLNGSAGNDELDGEPAGCFYDDATSGYYFYQVLLAR